MLCLYPHGTAQAGVLLTAIVLLEYLAISGVTCVITALNMLVNQASDPAHIMFHVNSALGIFVLAGGFFIQQEDASLLWQPIYFISPPNYAFRAAIRVVLSGQIIDSTTVCETGSLECLSAVDGDAFLQGAGYADTDCFSSMLGLLSIWIGCLLITWGLLEVKATGGFHLVLACICRCRPHINPRTSPSTCGAVGPQVGTAAGRDSMRSNSSFVKRHVRSLLKGGVESAAAEPPESDEPEPEDKVTKSLSLLLREAFDFEPTLHGIAAAEAGKTRCQTATLPEEKESAPTDTIRGGNPREAVPQSWWQGSDSTHTSLFA